MNNTGDEPDSDPNDGLCKSVPSNQCTLRAAIMQANHDAVPVTITIPPGTFVLSRRGFDDNALAGDLDIAGDLTLVGAGAGLTSVDGNGALTGDRVFHVLAAPRAVNLSGMTIRGGVAPTDTFPGGLGGGLFVDGMTGFPYRVRTLNGIVVESNTALKGGGLYTNLGYVELDNSIIQGNTAVDGGGINSAGSVLTLTHTTLRANTASNQGGGLRGDDILPIVRDSKVYSNAALQGGGMALTNAILGQLERDEISSNPADMGGGIYISTFYKFAMQDSLLHDNHAATGGGGIYQYAYPSLDLVRVTLDANTAGLVGGGMVITHVNRGVPAFIIDSTLSRNSAQYGGAIYQQTSAGDAGILLFQNSTLSGNSVSHEGGGIYSIGDSRIFLLNATIAANSVRPGFVHSFLAAGGGVFITTTAVLTLHNSLLADNINTDGFLQLAGDDCFTGPATSLRSLAFNLVETTTNCLLSGINFGLVIGQDPQLGPLQNNGGPTKTQAPKPGSPAVDAGDTGGCTDYLNNPLLADQRGFARPGNLRCDIGAVEYYPPAGFLPVIVR